MYSEVQASGEAQRCATSRTFCRAEVHGASLYLLHAAGENSCAVKFNTVTGKAAKIFMR